MHHEVNKAVSFRGLWALTEDMPHVYEINDHIRHLATLKVDDTCYKPVTSIWPKDWSLYG
jgi:hypothetical protein